MNQEGGCLVGVGGCCVNDTLDLVKTLTRIELCANADQIIQLEEVEKFITTTKNFLLKILYYYYYYYVPPIVFMFLLQAS